MVNLSTPAPGKTAWQWYSTMVDQPCLKGMVNIPEPIGIFTLRILTVQFFQRKT